MEHLSQTRSYGVVTFIYCYNNYDEESIENRANLLLGT